MRVLLQVVQEASVTIGGEEISRIGRGFLLFVGFRESDTEEIVKKTVSKAVSLRVFADSQRKMNLGLEEVGGQILCVSQFTLYADVKKGRRPSFSAASGGALSRPLYEKAVAYIRELGYDCRTGRFGADMKIGLINDGPTTILIDSEEL